MTDDEVRQWLSEEERMHFDSAAVVIIEDRRSPVLYAALRSLAATRRALAEIEWAGTCNYDTPWCQFCQVDVKRDRSQQHLPDCIFSTMPRPPQTR